MNKRYIKTLLEYLPLSIRDPNARLNAYLRKKMIAESLINKIAQKRQERTDSSKK